MLLFIEGYPYSLDNTVRDGLAVQRYTQGCSFRSG